MNHEHEAFAGINFILAGCLMSPEERTAVETIMEDKYNTGMVELKAGEEESKDNSPTKGEVNEDITITTEVKSQENRIALPIRTVSTEKESVNRAPINNEEISDGKVKISMRSFLLENKNLLSQVETVKDSKKPETGIEERTMDTMDRSVSSIVPIKCDLCIVTFKSNASLKRHKRKQHGISEKSVTAEAECTNNKNPVSNSVTMSSESPIEKKSSQPLNLSQESSSTDFHKCEKCDAKFKLEGNLNKHMKIAHPEPVGMKPIKEEPEKDATSTPQIIPTANLTIKTVEALTNRGPKSIVKTVEALNNPSPNLTVETVEAVNNPSPKLTVKTVEALNNPSPKLTVKTVEALNNSVGRTPAKKMSKELPNEECLQSKNDCNQQYEEEVLVKTEVLMNGDVKTLKCDQCNKQFIMERNLSLHKRVAHGRTSIRNMVLPKVPKFNFTCSPCKIKFESKTHLENHEKWSHKKETDEESVAKVNLEKVSISKVFQHVDSPSINLGSLPKQPLEFTKKSIKKEPKELVQMPCSKCPIVFGNVLSLKRHTLKRHGVSKLKCTFCKRQFKTSSEYFLHMKQGHMPNTNSKTEKFVCDVCNMVLQHKPSLARHKLKIHGSEEIEKSSSEDAKNIKPTFVAEMKKKIENDLEEMDTAEIDAPVKSEELNSHDQIVDTSVTLEESSTVVDLSTSQYFVSHPSMMRALSQRMHQKLLDRNLIVEDNNLPAGWSILNTLRKGKLSNKEFITPDRKVIRSVDGMREYMRVSNNYSRVEIQSVSKYFRKRMPLSL